MGNLHFSIAAQNVVQYRALAKKMRDAGRKDLRSALRKRISEAGKPVVEEVRAAVRGLHVTSSHGGGTAQRRGYNVSRTKTAKSADRVRRRGAGLRESIASATRLQITTKGVRFLVDSKKLPPDQRTLPRHLDSARGWRHPVFGHRDYAGWVTQKGGPYFANTIKKRAPAFRQAIVDAMDDITAELES